MRPDDPKPVAGAAPPAQPDWIEQQLRQWLWLGHGHEFAALYGDDGEMQCHQCAPLWDYKRTPIKTLVEHVDMLKLKQLSAAYKTLALSASPAPEPGGRAQPPETCWWCDGDVTKGSHSMEFGCHGEGLRASRAEVTESGSRAQPRPPTFDVNRVIQALAKVGVHVHFGVTTDGELIAYRGKVRTA